MMMMVDSRVKKEKSVLEVVEQNLHRLEDGDAPDALSS